MEKSGIENKHAPSPLAPPPQKNSFTHSCLAPPLPPPNSKTCCAVPATWLIHKLLNHNSVTFLRDTRHGMIHAIKLDTSEWLTTTCIVILEHFATIWKPLKNYRRPEILNLLWKRRTSFNPSFEISHATSFVDSAGLSYFPKAIPLRKACLPCRSNTGKRKWLDCVFLSWWQLPQGRTMPWVKASIHQTIRRIIHLNSQAITNNHHHQGNIHRHSPTIRYLTIW